LPNLVGSKPVVVLVNGNSASAAEMFAGALRDAIGASLVGTKTFGKGIAQITVDLARGASVQVTFAEYFLPKGDAVHGQSISPTNASRPAIGPTDAQLAEAVRVAKERMQP
jgi:carboxyl-terminal processing protease